MGIRVLPPRFASYNEAIRQIADRINALARGRSNAGGHVTLADGVTETVVTDDNVSADSIVALTALSASAAAALTGTYVDPVENGRFTIKHANSTGQARLMGYLIQG